MEVDSHVDYPTILRQVAAGQDLEKDKWLGLRGHIFDRINTIAHQEFPIPSLPPPRTLQLPQQRLLSAIPSSQTDPSSQEADKENAPDKRPSDRAHPEQQDVPEAAVTTAAAPQQLEPGQLPAQLESMLASIKLHLEAFTEYPPHTIQRVAELAHEPTAHYKALASYLHALDRVVQVTSGTNTYPLPPAVPDMSQLRVNGDAGYGGDPHAKEEAIPSVGATSSSWINAHNGVGSDEALGGALLTPIPWLRQPSPDSGANGPAGTGMDGGGGAAAQIHSEGSEAVDGPNGVGGVETVSVSVNGIPSTGHSRPVTQGELLRQEQEKGIVPVSQLNRPVESTPLIVSNATGPASGGDAAGTTAMAAGAMTATPSTEPEDAEEGEAQNEDADDSPHARGPEEIGMSDTGPQGRTTSYIGEDGMNVQAIDVAAAVGRKPEADLEHAQDVENVDRAGTGKEADNAGSPATSEESAGIKREAEDKLSGEAKKVKETGVADTDEGNAQDSQQTAETRSE